MDHKFSLRNYYLYPFEAGIGVFVILNALLTFFPDSAVAVNLWNYVGPLYVLLVAVQAFAGVIKLIGLGFSKANLEAAGLIIVSGMFLIRALTLITDGDITLTDINSVFYSSIIIVCNLVRLNQILRNQKVKAVVL